ncbi:hypothetical protein T08_5581 [Trichinella sp. T8]|nr:hypothetical protein T08_5581 [Trichinella sp. T8]
MQFNNTLHFHCIPLKDSPLLRNFVTQFAWLYGHGKKALSERRTNNKAMPNYVALLEKELCLKDRGCHQSAVFH